MDIKKGWKIILIAVSMVMFCVLAFAGERVQDKASSQNAAASEMMLANNSQTTPQVVNDGLEGLRVEQEEKGEQSPFLYAKTCNDACTAYCSCADQSPSNPNCGNKPNGCDCNLCG